jgi:hypothetical protein
MRRNEQGRLAAFDVDNEYFQCLVGGAQRRNTESNEKREENDPHASDRIKTL